MPHGFGLGDGLSARVRRALDEEEGSGLTFAFRARSLAVLAVIVSLPFLVEWARLWYYVSVALLLLLLGLAPHLLRRHRYATAIRYGFVLLDIVVITLVVILPVPGGLDIGWPMQMRLRFSDHLYLLLPIGTAALSYSALQVLWTGACAIAVWTLAGMTLYLRADTVRNTEATPPAAVEAVLRVILDPYYVSPSLLAKQMILMAILTGLLAAAVWRSRAMLVRQTRAELARSDLSRYVSAEVAEAIMTNEEPLGTPTTRVVTILFADIVGFTRLSERMTPERTVRLLRSFHERCSRVVFDHGGSIDKFMGDGFLATFGAVTEMPDAPARGLRCALALQAEMDSWNVERIARSSDAVDLAIGLHCGPVVVGNIGSDLHLEFTVIGDTANLASRIESLTRNLACRIAVSEACYEIARQHDRDLPGFTALGPVSVPGREQAIALRVWPTAAGCAGAATGTPG